MDHPHAEIVDRVCAKVGGATQLSKMLGIWPSAVSNWRRDGLPPARVGRICALTGYQPHELRPDLFPAPAASSGGVVHQGAP